MKEKKSYKHFWHYVTESFVNTDHNFLQIRQEMQNMKNCQALNRHAISSTFYEMCHFIFPEWDRCQNEYFLNVYFVVGKTECF